MKRFLIIFTTLAMLLSTAACSKKEAKPSVKPDTEQEKKPIYSVPAPMATPDYTFSGTPTTDELRQTALQGMRDLLSIQWHTATEISYYKTGPMSHKRFEHLPKNVYGGTLYSNASTGIFQFLEFYNQETGELKYPGEPHELKEAIGNSCADSLLWGYSTVCNSITGGFFPATMVYANGYIPVGRYTYDYSVDNYNKYPSSKIVKANGQDVIIESYTLVQPADALVSTTANHAMMVVGAPKVSYNDDGSVDLANSYIPIQDQRAGSGEGFYDEIVDGYLVRFSGRTYYDFPFSELLEKHYIPVTTAEFMGTKPYEKATVTLSKECATVNDLLRAKVESNYPLAVIRITLTDTKGTQTVIGRELFGGNAATGVPRSFMLSYMDCLVKFEKSEYNKAGNTLLLEAIASTGESFKLAELTI